MTRDRSMRRGFTLVELLVSVTILSILAGMALLTMFRAQQQARLARTRTQIAKINELLMQKWQTYKTRPAPARFVPPPRGSIPIQQYQRNVQSLRRQFRLLAMRDLMRMEMPDRITDVRDGPSPLTPGLASPSVRSAYLQAWSSAEARAGGAVWSTTHQSSECLYLILSNMRDGESSALDFFRQEEIGDTDNDGMLEILDGLGRPIYWLRWAPGFSQTVGADGDWGVAGVDDDGNGAIDDHVEAGWPGSDDEIYSDSQTRNAAKSPDFFDMLLVDPRHSDADTTFNPFGLYPLIYSAGEDGVYDIYQADEPFVVPLSGPIPATFRYRLTEYPSGSAYPNDPYTSPSNAPNLAAILGTPTGYGVTDNLINQNMETRGE